MFPSLTRPPPIAPGWVSSFFPTWSSKNLVQLGPLSCPTKEEIFPSKCCFFLLFFVFYCYWHKCCLYSLILGKFSKPLIHSLMKKPSSTSSILFCTDVRLHMFLRLVEINEVDCLNFLHDLKQEWRMGRSCNFAGSCWLGMHIQFIWLHHIICFLKFWIVNIEALFVEVGGDPYWS